MRILFTPNGTDGNSPNGGSDPTPSSPTKPPFIVPLEIDQLARESISNPAAGAVGLIAHYAKCLSSDPVDPRILSAPIPEQIEYYRSVISEAIIAKSTFANTDTYERQLELITKHIERFELFLVQFEQFSDALARYGFNPRGVLADPTKVGSTDIAISPEERETLKHLSDAIFPVLGVMLERFELLADHAQKDVSREELTALCMTLHTHPDERSLPQIKDGLRVQKTPYLLSRSPFLYRVVNAIGPEVGDTRTIHAILNDDPCMGEGAFAQLANIGFLNAQVACAHRNRILIVRDSILSTIKSQGQAAQSEPLRFLSVGPGPAKAWVEVIKALRADPNHTRDIQITLFDRDPIALDVAQRNLSAAYGAAGENSWKISVVPLNTDVWKFMLRVRNGSAENHAPYAPIFDKPFDYIEMAGLLDYVKDDLAQLFVPALSYRLAPGGRLLFTNVTDHGAMFTQDFIFRWPLIYRGVKSSGECLGMEDLTASLPKEQFDTLQVVADATNVNLFGEVVRKA